MESNASIKKLKKKAKMDALWTHYGRHPQVNTQTDDIFLNKLQKKPREIVQFINNAKRSWFYSLVFSSASLWLRYSVDLFISSIVNIMQFAILIRYFGIMIMSGISGRAVELFKDAFCSILHIVWKLIEYEIGYL